MDSKYTAWTLVGIAFAIAFGAIFAGPTCVQDDANRRDFNTKITILDMIQKNPELKDSEVIKEMLEDVD